MVKVNDENVTYDGTEFWPGELAIHTEDDCNGVVVNKFNSNHEYEKSFCSKCDKVIPKKQVDGAFARYDEENASTATVVEEGEE